MFSTSNPFIVRSDKDFLPYSIIYFFCYIYRTISDIIFIIQLIKFKITIQIVVLLYVYTNLYVIVELIMF